MTKKKKSGKGNGAGSKATQIGQPNGNKAIDPKELALLNRDNHYAEKFKTDESRRKLFKDLIEHLESGLSHHTFVPCDWETVERYVLLYPQVFEAQTILEARRRGHAWWEKLGATGAAGKIPHFNATAWLFNLKNKYPDVWKDKTEVDQTLHHDPIEIQIVQPPPDGGGSEKAIGGV